jgi:lipoprotein-anchoring transpeptidase ErfK/SrfK
MKGMVKRLSLLFVSPLALMLMLILVIPEPDSQAKSATPAAITIKENTDNTENQNNVTTASAAKVEPVIQIPQNKHAGKPIYLVKVNRRKQQMTVWETKNGVKRAIHTMPCATGKRYTPTPKGTFKMKPIGKFLYDRKYHCYLKYVIRFKGSYLIHSVPVSAAGKVLDRTIGKPASHGCIRLRIEDAKWLYQLPSGTKVLIE